MDKWINQPVYKFTDIYENSYNLIKNINNKKFVAPIMAQTHMYDLKVSRKMWCRHIL